GRKNKDSLYTKLMSKPEVTAAQIYDKLRFRIVTREPDDVFAILRHLVHHVFPFNYVIPGESTNTIFNFRSFCDSFPALEKLTHQTQFPVNFEDHEANKMENAFSSSSYRVVHFVVDMPIRLPEAMVRSAPPAAWALGPVIFSQTEFQILDHQNDRDNEMGPASHDAYKQRQKLAVMRRLKLGRGNRRTATSQATDMMATDYSGSDEASLSDPEEKASQDASSDEE
ncbi:MAG: TIGR04552 family protein, partial [Myxococcota bacterium]